MILRSLALPSAPKSNNHHYQSKVIACVYVDNHANAVNRLLIYYVKSAVPFLLLSQWKFIHDTNIADERGNQSLQITQCYFQAVQSRYTNIYVINIAPSTLSKMIPHFVWCVMITVPTRRLYIYRQRSRETMRLIASVRPSVCLTSHNPKFASENSHYQSKVFVCVSVISSADAIDRLLIFVKMRFSSFKKCTIFDWHYGDVCLAVIIIFNIFKVTS